MTGTVFQFYMSDTGVEFSVPVPDGIVDKARKYLRELLGLQASAGAQRSPDVYLVSREQYAQFSAFVAAARREQM
jgi:hypothetical protein